MYIVVVIPQDPHLQSTSILTLLCNIMQYLEANSNGIQRTTYNVKQVHHTHLPSLQRELIPKHTHLVHSGRECVRACKRLTLDSHLPHPPKVHLSFAVYRCPFARYDLVSNPTPPNLNTSHTPTTTPISHNSKQDSASQKHPKQYNNHSLHCYHNSLPSSASAFASEHPTLLYPLSHSLSQSLPLPFSLCLSNSPWNSL